MSIDTASKGKKRIMRLKGDRNSLNYKYRMHDPRVGRFFATDPLEPKYPHYTPYSFSGNKVIHAIELEGLEEVNLTGDARYGNLFAPILNSITSYSTPNSTTIDLSKTENSVIKRRIENTLGVTLHADWIIDVDIDDYTESEYFEEEYLNGATGVDITDNTIYNSNIIIYDLYGKVIYEKEVVIKITDGTFGILLENGDSGVPERYIWNPSDVDINTDVEQTEDNGPVNKPKGSPGWQNVKNGDSVTIGATPGMRWAANYPLFIKINDSTAQQPETSGYITPQDAVEVYNVNANDSVFKIITINHNGDTTSTDVTNTTIK